MRALLPLWPPELTPLLPNAQESDYRSFTTAIPATLQRASEAAVDIRNGKATLSRWEDEVEHGVTANLCDAIARHLGDGANTGTFVDSDVVEVGCYFSPAHGLDQEIAMPPLSISAGLVSVFQGGSSLLLGQPERSEMIIQGYVNNLRRKSSESIGPGTIQVTGRIVEGAGPADSDDERKFLVSVDEATHREAYEAYNSDVEVRVTLEMERTSKGLSPKRVVDFREVEAAAQTGPAEEGPERSSDQPELFDQL